MNIGHVDVLLSQFAVFCAVRNEERDRHGVQLIFAGIHAELPVKRPGEGVHIGKSGIVRRVDDLNVPAAKLLCRLGEPVFADVLRGRQSQIIPEQSIGIPRGKQRRPREIGQTDFLRFVFFTEC